ncbi:MAG TPA: hypothetical protein VF221_17160 [Chloroflexota bacterium]
MDDRDALEQRTEHEILVRQVTDIRAAWSERERGHPGAFTLQIIMDNGVSEYILRPTAEDARVILELWEKSNNASFDLGRKVLIFGSI